MIRTSHDLPQDTREAMVALLNRQLADTFDLYSQVKQAHWNVKGPEFAQLHELYDQVAGAVLPFVDEIPDGPLSDGASIGAVAKGLASLAASTRAAIDTSGDAGDEGTADLFTGLSRELDKLLWFVEAHTQSA